MSKERSGAGEALRTAPNLASKLVLVRFEDSPAPYNIREDFVSNAANISHIPFETHGRDGRATPRVL